MYLFFVSIYGTSYRGEAVGSHLIYIYSVNDLFGFSKINRCFIKVANALCFFYI